MKKGIQQIEVRNSRHGVVVQTIGRTARGVRYLIQEEKVPDVKPGDKDYKVKIVGAANKLLESEA